MGYIQKEVRCFNHLYKVVDKVFKNVLPYRGSGWLLFCCGFEWVGIDISNVLEAAKTKYNFQVHYPGPGVGGPCLPVNSYQMINLAKTWGLETLQMVEMGRKINESMSEHVIELLNIHAFLLKRIF
jgi:hypothetical protein